MGGDLARTDVPTCGPDDRLGDIPERVIASGYDLCIVLNEHRIVLGLRRGDALSKDPEAQVGDVMELGPTTLRPNNPIEKLLQSQANDGIKSWIVTTSHGVLLGALIRTDAERALEESQARAAASSDGLIVRQPFRELPRQGLWPSGPRVVGIRQPGDVRL